MRAGGPGLWPVMSAWGPPPVWTWAWGPGARRVGGWSGAQGDGADSGCPGAHSGRAGLMCVGGGGGRQGGSRVRPRRPLPSPGPLSGGAAWEGGTRAVGHGMWSARRGHSGHGCVLCGGVGVGRAPPLPYRRRGPGGGLCPGGQCKAITKQGKGMGGGGSKGGVWLGPPLLPGSPCGPRRRRAKHFEASILLAPKALKQNFGCQPQTLEGEGGGGLGGPGEGGTPPLLLRRMAVLTHHWGGGGVQRRAACSPIQHRTLQRPAPGGGGGHGAPGLAQVPAGLLAPPTELVGACSGVLPGGWPFWASCHTPPPPPIPP